MSRNKEPWELDFPEDIINGIYMEGVINHMIEAGIDPATHDPVNYIYFQEMAGRLPRDKTGNCNLIIAVGGNEGTIPHFHVFRKEEDLESWRNGACLFLTDNSYFDHSGNTETLTKDELAQVIGRLKETVKKRKISNWEYIVMLWNDNNPNYEIDYDTPMPDYDYKTIKRYEEHKKDKKKNNG